MKNKGKYKTYSTKKNMKKKDKKRCRLYTKDLWDIKNKHKTDDVYIEEDEA